MVKIEKSIIVIIDGNDVSTLSSICELARLAIESRKNENMIIKEEQLAARCGMYLSEFRLINEFMEKIFEET